MATKPRVCLGRTHGLDKNRKELYLNSETNENRVVEADTSEEPRLSLPWIHMGSISSMWILDSTVNPEVAKRLVKENGN